jgi:hypothetical protein
MHGEMHIKFIRKPEGGDHLQGVCGDEWVLLAWIVNKKLRFCVLTQWWTFEQIVEPSMNVWYDWLRDC